MGLTGGELQLHRQVGSINESVDLGGQSPFRTAHADDAGSYQAGGLGAPFFTRRTLLAYWWTLMDVIQDSFCGGYFSAVADGGCRVGILCLFLITVQGQGDCPVSNHRLVLEGIFWIARTSAAWRDLPEEFGKWSSVYRQSRRWTLAGLWELVLDAFNNSSAVPDSVQKINSTVICAHHLATGKKGAPRPPVWYDPTPSAWGVREEASRPQSTSLPKLTASLSGRKRLAAKSPTSEALMRWSVMTCQPLACSWPTGAMTAIISATRLPNVAERPLSQQRPTAKSRARTIPSPTLCNTGSSDALPSSNACAALPYAMTKSQQATLASYTSPLCASGPISLSTGPS